MTPCTLIIDDGSSEEGTERREEVPAQSTQDRPTPVANLASSRRVKAHVSRARRADRRRQAVHEKETRTAREGASAREEGKERLEAPHRHQAFAPIDRRRWRRGGTGCRIAAGCGRRPADDLSSIAETHRIASHRRPPLGTRGPPLFAPRCMTLLPVHMVHACCFFAVPARDQSADYWVCPACSPRRTGVAVAAAAAADACLLSVLRTISSILVMTS